MSNVKNMRRVAVLAVIPVAVWSGYWIAGAYAFEQAAVLASGEARRAGLAAEFTDAAVRGYPTRFAMALSDITVSDDRLIWYTQAVEVEADSHRPFDVEVDFSQPHRISGRFGDVHIDSGAAQLSVLFQPEWRLPLGEIALDAADVIVESPDTWRIDTTRVLSALRQSPVDETTYRVAASIEEMNVSGLLEDFPPEFRAIPEIHLEGGLRFDRSWDRAVLQDGLPALLEFRLSRAAFEYGPSTIILQAQLDREEGAAFSGVVNITVQDWQRLYELAQHLGYIEAELHDFFLPMLEELASQNEPETELTLPLRIQNGTVSYGSITVGMLPEVR